MRVSDKVRAGPFGSARVRAGPVGSGRARVVEFSYYATKSQRATRQSQRLRLKSSTRATKSRDTIAGVTSVLLTRTVVAAVQADVGTGADTTAVDQPMSRVIEPRSRTRRSLRR